MVYGQLYSGRLGAYWSRGILITNFNRSIGGAIDEECGSSIILCIVMNPIRIYFYVPLRRMVNLLLAGITRMAKVSSAA